MDTNGRLNLKDKTICVIDNGLFVSIARMLSRDFGRVLYFTPWVNAFPKSNSLLVGDGFDDIERIKHPWNHVDEVDLWCYDDQTEILTEDGWRFFRDLEKNQKVATLNPISKRLEYQQPERHICYDYSGEMMSIETCRVNFKVTPWHKLYVRKQRKPDFELVIASDIYGRTNLEFQKTCIWEGIETPVIRIPEYVVEWRTSRRGAVHRRNVWPAFDIPSDTMLAIIGFYLSEGSIMRRNGNRPCGVEFGQDSGETLTEFLSVLDNAKLDYTIRPRRGRFNIVRINSSQIGNFFLQFGEREEKMIPKSFKALSSRQLSILFSWYMKGDGYATGQGFTTVSHQLSDDLQEVALKIGKSASEKPIKSKRFVSPNGKTYTNKPGYRVNLSSIYNSPCISRNEWKKTDYHGKVYCVTVPNHIIYVRRNGVPIWCGNCFPDVYFADWQNMLVRLGKRVWGARNGDTMELYRHESKELLKTLGLPVGNYAVVEGVEKLREYLKEHEDVWVKVSCVRGDFETFHSMNYDLSEPKLDELAYKMGAKGKVAEFIVEDAINDAVEIGYDGFTVDGKFPSGDVLFGVESKDVSYFGAVMPYDELPEPVKFVNSKLSPWLERQEYRGFFSTEVRIKDGVPYLIDPCARSGSPPSELYQELFTNWGEVIWNGSEGRLVELEPIAKYGVMAMIHSSFADHNWQAVDVPEDVEQWVKLRNHTRIDGKDYCVPQEVGLPEIGAVIGVGDTLEEAVHHCRHNAEQIKGYFLDIKMNELGNVISEAMEAQENGIDFGITHRVSDGELISLKTEND